MRFVALDVETANSDPGSICAIGAAVFIDGRVEDEIYQLINPRARFDAMNISVHGIEPEAVASAPDFQTYAGALGSALGGHVIVHHTHFDRTAMNAAVSRCRPADAAEWVQTCTWLDSAAVARRTWSECARRGYGLSALCDRIGYQFDHHHALEDAKAAGYVLLACMNETGLDLSGTIEVAGRPLPRQPLPRGGDQVGILTGERIVFTGALAIPRRAAAEAAVSLGAKVFNSVSAKTTILVLGDSDESFVDGVSGKYRRALALNEGGCDIRIVGEAEFLAMIAES